ncbi:hypothetical protein BH10PSE14_BH10PSE14_06320 [soil metagenome]
MAYAENTSVPIEKSVAEIVGLVKKAGATSIAQWEEPARFTIQFSLSARLLRFRVTLPAWQDMPERNGRREVLSQAQREVIAARRAMQRARALLLVIKAKLESVESNVESFEEAFLANVVMADGATVYERVAQPIALEYQTGAPSTMLLAGPSNMGKS